MTALLGMNPFIQVTYLVATALFILALKWLSSPATARHGVWAGELGMLLAVGGTLLDRGIVDYRFIAIGLVLGSIIGVPLGMVHMTAVPQRTALSHAFGALCVTLVGTAEFYLRAPNISRFMMSILSLEVILGGLTITGSLMAAGKLQEVLPQRPITYKGQNFVNLGMLAIAVVIAVYLVLNPDAMHLYPVMVGIALVLGAIIGVPLGNVQMTAVPQRTALSHAFGALCVTLVGTAEFYLRAVYGPAAAFRDIGFTLDDLPMIVGIQNADRPTAFEASVDLRQKRAQVIAGTNDIVPLGLAAAV